MSWLIWLGIAVALLLVEFATVDLVAVWFSASALILVIVTAIFPSLPLIWQFCIFLVLSTVLVLSTRRIVKRMLAHRKDQETNLELIVNHTARVVTEINNDLEVGEAKINGVIWSARSKSGEIIAPEELVTVMEIKGNKLIVAKK